VAPLTPIQTGVGRLPNRRARRALIRFRVWLHQPRLDAALADGADPWSSDELYVRAVQLTSREERRALASALQELVTRAQSGRPGRPYRRLRKRQPTSPYPGLRRRAILDRHEELLDLAERIGGPAPTPVSVVAQLMLLCCARTSPVFAAGRPVDELDEILTDALEALTV
jgi:hypothetical protein